MQKRGLFENFSQMFEPLKKKMLVGFLVDFRVMLGKIPVVFLIFIHVPYTSFAANETLHPLGEHRNIGSATKLFQLPSQCMCKLKLEKTSSNLRSNFKEI